MASTGKNLRENPFRPGFGELPPLLAGREREQQELSTRVRGLLRGGSRQGFIIYGPRGMGKTVLLQWVVGEAKRITAEIGQPLSVIRESAPTMFASKESVLNALSRDERMLSQIETSITSKFLSVFGGTVRKTEVAIDRRWDSLKDTLAAACQKSPMVLLLDEAHTIDSIDTDLYQHFLNRVQLLIADAPFLLVLAGTPDLPDALISINATFGGRGQKMGLSLLDAEAAAAAIRDPLAADGIEIADDALAFVAEDSQHYPYFLQLWGRYLWNKASEQGLGRLGLRDAEDAGQEVGGAKLDYYKERYDEVSINDLAEAAAGAVAEAFIKKAPISKGKVLAAMKKAMPPHLAQGDDLDQKARALLRYLRHKGFVWEPPHEDTMSPGIPSLMDYTLARIQRGG